MVNPVVTPSTSATQADRPLPHRDERLSPEDRLAVSEQRLRLLADNAKDVVWSMSPAGEITLPNLRAFFSHRHWHWDSATLAGTTVPRTGTGA